MFIVCSDGDLRLVDSERIGEGRVEICFNNTFGSVCADFWDEMDAQVVCGQLGFMRNGQVSFRFYNICTLAFITFAGSLPNTTTSGSSVFLSNIQCNGNEAMLSECSTSTATQCPRAEFAGVRCEGMTCFISNNHITLTLEMHTFF